MVNGLMELETEIAKAQKGQKGQAENGQGSRESLSLTIHPMENFPLSGQVMQAADSRQHCF